MQEYKVKETTIRVNGETLEGYSLAQACEPVGGETEAQIVTRVAKSMGLDLDKVWRDLARAKKLRARALRQKSDLDERQAQGPNRHARRAAHAGQ